MKRKIIATILFVLSLACLLLVEVKLKNLTGLPTILDKMFFYNEANIRHMIGVMGENGRKLYQYLHGVDFIFITAFAFMQIEFMRDRLDRPGMEISINKFVFFVPIFVRAITDVFENLAIDTIILMYPEIPPILARISYTMTFLKWVSLSVIIAQILYVIIKTKRAPAISWFNL